jgi:hypothetical protein
MYNLQCFAELTELGLKVSSLFVQDLPTCACNVISAFDLYIHFLHSEPRDSIDKRSRAHASKITDFEINVLSEDLIRTFCTL